MKPEREKARIRRKLVREVEQMLANGGVAHIASYGDWNASGGRSIEKLLREYPVVVHRYNERWWIVRL